MFASDLPPTTLRDPLDWIDDQLTRLDEADLRRRLRDRSGPQGPLVTVDARRLVNFASNDYLGLAGHPRLVEAAIQAARADGWGSGASPLIAGHGGPHAELERRLAEFEGTESALVFCSGYAANVGAITALVGRGDTVFSDALNHASIIDGCRLSRADVRVYRHGDVDHLARLLAAADSPGRRLIVTDSLFSMDGDLAPLPALAELAQRHQAILAVDEAHATGLFGQGGRGVAEHLGVLEGVHVRVGTLSKALGSIGGFVAGRRSLVEWLVNRARPYVFSTALPGAALAAAAAALDLVVAEPQRRRSLLETAAQLRTALQAGGWNVGASASQIIPLFVGDPARALAMSKALEDQGMWVPAIRPPSVPQGRSLLRISLAAGHTREMIARLAAALGSMGPPP